MTSRVSVSLGLWLDRPPGEVLTTARVADGCGYPELWVGEMATYDAFALATAIGMTTKTISLTVGPLAVAVRDPAMIAMGAASVADLCGRPCGVALGTSSQMVVEAWHGRSRARSATALRESAAAVRQLLAGERLSAGGQVVTARDYRLRLPPPDGQVTIAAFGASAIQAAADLSDRMVVNLVSVPALRDLRDSLDQAVSRAGRAARPSLAIWVPTAVDPARAAFDQLRRALVAYLAAPGYADMFERAGAGAAVAAARAGAHPRELLGAVADDVIERVAAVGSAAEVQQRFAQYAAAGADEVVIVPVCTDDDPAGAHTLEALAS